MGYSKTLRAKFSDYHFPWILMLNDKSTLLHLQLLPPSLNKGCPFHYTIGTNTSRNSAESVQTQESLETWYKFESVETNTFTYRHSQLMQVGHRLASLNSGAKGGVKRASHIPFLPFTALCEKYFLFMHIWDKISVSEPSSNQYYGEKSALIYVFSTLK